MSIPARNSRRKTVIGFVSSKYMNC